MRISKCVILVLLSLVISCKNNTDTNAVAEVNDTIKSKANERISNKIAEVLIPEAREAVANWEEYQQVDDFILKYYNISKDDALANANELAELASYMKDSVTITKLQEPNFTTRLNVFHNETLRLSDMATINAITFEEIEVEVAKILELYSAINSKINTIYQAEALQKLLEFDTEKPVELPKSIKDSLEGLRRGKLIKPKISSEEKILE